jgi:hypothetical protein
VGVGQIDLNTSPTTTITPVTGETPNVISNGVTAAGVPSAQSDAGVMIPDAMIEEIVQRVVQRLSTQVVQEIAWEVVPEMAELLIRKQLSQQRASH